jgi:hypothetical protein
MASTSTSTPLQSSCEWDLTPGNPAAVAVYQSGTTDEPLGEVGELSMPAQLGCSVRPTSHGFRADTTVRPLLLLETIDPLVDEF